MRSISFNGRPGPVELVVHAHTNSVEGKVGREAVSRVWGASSKVPTNEAIVRRPQVCVKVFRFNGPISGIHPLNACPRCPANMIFIGRPHRSHQTTWNYIRYQFVRLGLPKGNTSRAIEQEIIYSNTRTAANGSEPI